MPALGTREAAHCRRCGKRLATGRRHDPRHGLACAATALIFLGLALAFDFMHFEVQGKGQTIDVLGAIATMSTSGQPLVGLLVLLCVVLLPAACLLAVCYLGVCLALGRKLAGAGPMAHWLQRVRPWMMSDVFVIGALISLIKIVSLGIIGLGPSFYAFCAYVLLLMITLLLFEPAVFWQRFGAPVGPSLRVVPGQSAAGQGLVGCRACGQPFACSRSSTCPRCGRHHLLLRADRRQWTLALIATAALLLVPANLYPMLHSSSLGWSSSSTIVGGVQQLIAAGSWPIALIIFVASIIIPIAKILGLGWLCIETGRRRPRVSPGDVWLYRVTAVIGRWSMIDIFVITIVTALISAGQIMQARPGPAALPFAAAVILTMAAAVTFDPRLLWRRADPQPVSR